MDKGMKIYEEGTKWLRKHGYSHLKLVGIDQQANGPLSWSFDTEDKTKPYPNEKEISELEAHLKEFARKTKAEEE